jgi:peptidoglycan/xylan/chitin deacetylase (PgdA/CDA1 family)
MNLVAFSIRTKGVYNFTRRLRTVFTRFGISEVPIHRALYMIIESLRKYGGAPTFFIPAVVLARHSKLISKIAIDGAEIGIHGYVHNDYRTLNKDAQFEQTKQAIAVFQKMDLPYFGFRNPYLGWTEESLDVYAALRFRYESNIAVLHDVVDLDEFSPLLRSGFAKSLKLFQAVPCNIYALRPHFEGDLLRIPTSIPDDEMLFDRLRITDLQVVGGIWSTVLQRVYDYGGLYTLNLHPERGVLCKEALDSLLSYAYNQPLPVWVARLGDIAKWWKERSEFRLRITSQDTNKWLVETSCDPRATLLARHLIVEDESVIPWYGQDVQIQSQRFTVNAACCPCIGISQQTSQEVINFLYEQGYPIAQSSQDKAHNYSMYVDIPEGLGSNLEDQAIRKRALVEQVEALEAPFLHFGCWPNSVRAALAISGDIDSVTVQDFFLRILEVFRNR